MSQPIDLLILSNGPGEITTWVKPVVQALRHQFGDDRTHLRISVILSPCNNASGNEAQVARSYPEVDRVQSAESFFPFLLFGQTVEQWDWRDRGVVLFLGGDQIFPVIIGNRLGYQTIVYAEWETRWHRWIDYFAIMKANVRDRVHPIYHDKFTVVGDLMSEASRYANSSTQIIDASVPTIGLLPGSKSLKLKPGLPLMLAIANHLHRDRPEIQFIIPVAPTLSLPALATYADPNQNSTIDQFGWASATLEFLDDARSQPILKTATGVEVRLSTQFPAYESLSRCTLCLTTVGANTAELGALGIPMLVLLPTQWMEYITAWDGLPGLLAKLPGLGRWVARWMGQQTMKRAGRLAWPNIWAQKEIIPELIGPLEPATIAQQILDLLDHPDRLELMRANLRSARGESGAAAQIVTLVARAIGNAETTPSP